MAKCHDNHNIMDSLGFSPIPWIDMNQKRDPNESASSQAAKWRGVGFRTVIRWIEKGGTAGASIARAGPTIVRPSPWASRSSGKWFPRY